MSDDSWSDIGEAPQERAPHYDVLTALVNSHIHRPRQGTGFEETEPERGDDASILSEFNTSSRDDIDYEDYYSDDTEPIPTQANDSGLDLRPVQASIDLRRRRPATWREYHTRVLGHARCPLARRTGGRNSRTSGASTGRRLRGGQPDTSHPVPALMDPQYGLIYMASESESEDDETLPPWAMVPRRGNSVSDLSQCSSDDEQPNAEQQT
ncbi:hypothetical protein KR093_000194 [Drosophila rubida]|uniref:Uncharacterized protein n=1 Tax=Drosophila rubida TaxID=30044 RepID=A0AAD4JXU0_9MUSC|nr:hypothetical protein KR093_000194 [Drosophila rubida]